MVSDWLLDEVDVVFRQSPEVSHGLRDAPGAVRVDPQAWAFAERLTNDRHQLEILRVLDADLEVEDVETCPQAVLHLHRDALARSTGQVVEVRGLMLLEPPEQAPDRLAAGVAAEIPE